MKQHYTTKVTVTFTAEYTTYSDDEEDAQEMALDLFWQSKMEDHQAEPECETLLDPWEYNDEGGDDVAE